MLEITLTYETIIIKTKNKARLWMFFTWFIKAQHEFPSQFTMSLSHNPLFECILI